MSLTQRVPQKHLNGATLPNLRLTSYQPQGGEREGLDLELGKDGVFTFKGDSSMW